jgi:hypothetical protein
MANRGSERSARNSGKKGGSRSSHARRASVKASSRLPPASAARARCEGDITSRGGVHKFRDAARSPLTTSRAARWSDEREDWLRRDPHLANIRNHPRFQQVLEAVVYRRKQRSYDRTENRSLIALPLVASSEQP